MSDTKLALMKKIQNNPLLKDIVVTEQNVLDCCFYLQEISHCEKCKDLAKCPNSLPGMKPQYDGKNLAYVRCKLQQIDLLKNNVNALFASNYLLDATLEDFALTTEARTKCLAYANKVLSSKKAFESGLYIFGSFGSGKTYFLSALANSLAQKNSKVVVVFMPDLSRELKHAMTDNSLEKKINAMKMADYLMLDDLGGEMMTSWLRDEVLAPVIQYRMINQLPLYISTNLDYPQLREHLSQTKDDLDNLKANRILERIKAMTKRVRFNEQFKK